MFVIFIITTIPTHLLSNDRYIEFERAVTVCFNLVSYCVISCTITIRKLYLVGQGRRPLHNNLISIRTDRMLIESEVKWKVKQPKVKSLQ